MEVQLHSFLTWLVDGGVSYTLPRKKKTLMLMEQCVGGAQQLVWRYFRKDRALGFTGIRTSDRGDRSLDDIATRLRRGCWCSSRMSTD